MIFNFIYFVNSSYVTDIIFVGRSGVENVFLVFFLVVVMVFFVCGNFVVIVVIFISRIFREELFNRLTINLVIIDLFNGLVVIFSSFFFVIFDFWRFGFVYCDLICVINYCFIIIFMLILCFISCDRF